VMTNKIDTAQKATKILKVMALPIPADNTPRFASSRSKNNLCEEE
jgi:hypothetical protein